MFYNTYRKLPVVMCLAGAAALTGCNNETDIAATTKATGSIAAAEPETPTVRTPEPMSEQDLAARREAAREARAQREARTRGQDGPVSGRDAARDLRGERSPGIASTVRDPAPSTRAPVVTVEPTTLDVGQMATGERRSGTVSLTNTSDTVIRLVDARTSCGCTVANVPRNYDMKPGETVTADVTLSSNANRAERLTKHVTFLFEDHPNVVMHVTGESIAYLTLEPHVIDPEQHPDGRLVVRSHDDEPFRIISITPLLALNLPEHEATEHEIEISWDQWRELRQPRRLEIAIDHPRAQVVAGTIRAPRVAPDVRPDTPSAREAAADRRARAERGRPLHELAQQGNAQLVMQQIGEGAEVDSTDAQGMSLLGVAARHGHVELMRALIEAGADVNHSSVRSGATPLMNAAQSKHVETVQVLLDAGADVNARDTTIGSTALSWAALSGDPATVRALLNAGAAVDVVSRATGWTPLTCAAGFGETESVKLLIEAGANLETACAIQGATPLMYAAGTGRVDNVKGLIDAGAELEAKDANGYTVFLFAARAAGADAKTVQALIDAGVDVHVKDSRGLNALDHARTRDDLRKAEVLAILEPLFKQAAD